MVRDYRKILLVGLPLVFNNLSSIAINVGDTLMIARFSEVHLAAIAIGSSVWISLFLFGLGLIMAIGPLVAQFFEPKFCSYKTDYIARFYTRVNNWFSYFYCNEKLFTDLFNFWNRFKYRRVSASLLERFKYRCISSFLLPCPQTSK